MPDIKIKVTRSSLSDQWPAETDATSNTFANSIMTWAANGRRNCSASVSLSDDGLSKSVLLSFPTGGDRDNWLIDLRAESDWTNVTSAMRGVNSGDNGLSVWFGNAEDEGVNDGFLNE